MQNLFIQVVCKRHSKTLCYLNSLNFLLKHFISENISIDFTFFINFKSNIGNIRIKYKTNILTCLKKQYLIKA